MKNFCKYFLLPLLAGLLVNGLVAGIGYKLGEAYNVNPVFAGLLTIGLVNLVSCLRQPKHPWFLRFMAMPGVNILIQNGTLGGLLQTEDGICGMVLTGVTEGTYTVGNCVLLRGYNDAINLGLTTTNNAFALKHIDEFYDEAGEGAKLYLQLVPSSMTTSQMADITNATGAVKLIDFAGRTLRYLGLLRDTTGQTVTVTNGMDADIATAVNNAQTLANTYAGSPKNYPFRVILGGQNFNGLATDLLDGNTLSRNRVAIVIGDTVSASKGAAVGLALGRKAKVPVQRNIGRVADGALNITQAFYGTTLVEQYTNTDMIHDKRFICFRTFAGKAGYFFNDDPTRTSTTDDYAYLGRGAVIDKAQVLAYAIYVEEVNGEVPIDPGNGKMEAGYCAYLEELIERQLNGIMTANREISGCKTYVDPAQNVLANNKVSIVLRIVPVGYAKTIEVKLGFATSI